MPKDKTLKKEKKDKKERKDKKDKKVKTVEENVAVVPSTSIEDERPVASTSSLQLTSSADVEGIEDATTAEDKDLLEIDTTLPAPLSKAQARKAKAKGLPPPAPVPSSALPDVEGVDGTEASGEKKSKKEKSTPVEKYSIWVGNLAFKTTEQQLRDFFAPALKPTKQWGSGGGEGSEETSAGEGEEVKDTGAGEEEVKIVRINLPKTLGNGKFGKNKGFAYIDFSTKEACHRAVKLSEGHLDGRALLIKLGTDFASRPASAASTALPDGKTKSRTVQALLAKQKQPPSATLFVGNLGFEATEEALRNLIETHWSTSMSSNRHSKPKKSSFLPEPSETAAAEAAKKAAAVESSDEDDSSDDDEDEDEDEDEAMAKRVRRAKKEEEKKVVAPIVEKASITDKDGNTQEIEVSGAGLRKVRVGQFQDTGKCKGFAFLDFHTAAQATAALIDMRNHRLDGRSLTLEYASPAATARSGSGTQTFNNPAAEAQMVEGVPVKVRPPPTPKTSTKKRLMKKERIAARLAAGLPPTVPVDAPNNPMPPPRNFGGERLAAKRVRGEDDQGADAAGDSATWEERKRPKPMNKWEKAGRTAPGGALALAKKESVAIVASEGKKVVFD